MYKNGKKKAELDKELGFEVHHIKRTIDSKKLIEKGFIEFYQIGDKPKDPYFIKIKTDPIIEYIKEISIKKRMKENNIFQILTMHEGERN